MNRPSDSSALLSGILFLVLAGIVAAGALMWRNFLEFSTGAMVSEEVFAGVSPQPADLPPDPYEAASRLVFGFVVARGDLVKFIESVQPGLNAITQPLGCRAAIDVSDSLQELQGKLEKGLVDIGAVTAVAYARLRREGRIRAILERTGKTAKRSLFLVRREAPIADLRGLQGAKIAFKGQDSMSGYTMPVIELKRRGIDPATFFGSQTFTGNARNSILGVLSGEFDCAVVSNTFFDELAPAERAALREIHASAAVPGGVYIATAASDTRLIDRVVQQFLAKAANPPGSEEFSGFFTVKEPDPTLYDFLEVAEEDEGS